MLVSLTKILLFVAAVVAAIFGVEMLLESGYTLRIAVAGTEFTLGPVQTLIAAGVLLLVVWIVIKLIGLLLATVHFLAGDETAITRYFARNRERRGFRALSDAMIALAGGDVAEANAKATKAENLLRRPDLTNLIRAQAAELSGDKPRATDAYKALLQDDRTRFVGVRGLMNQKLVEGDTDMALRLAEKAFVLKPRHAQTSDTLLQLQAGQQNWTGARKTLGAKLKYGSIPRDVHKRRDAVLALSDSRDRLAAGDASGARDEAIEANRKSPTLVPAAVAAADAYTALGKPRNAAKVLKSAWAVSPHPDLAAAFAQIVPDETPEARIKRFGELTKVKPDDPETKMLIAELEIAAENFPAARKALGDLAETLPTARTTTLMAAIERGEGSSDTTVRAWLAKALIVSRGPQWICDNCGQVHGQWEPVCTGCAAFDTLSWKTATEPVVMPDTASGMLPLIVGASKLEPEPEVATAEEEIIDLETVDDTAEAQPSEGDATEAPGDKELEKT